MTPLQAQARPGAWPACQAGAVRLPNPSLCRDRSGNPRPDIPYPPGDSSTHAPISWVTSDGILGVIAVARAAVSVAVRVAPASGTRRDGLFSMTVTRGSDVAPDFLLHRINRKAVRHHAGAVRGRQTSAPGITRSTRIPPPIGSRLGSRCAPVGSAHRGTKLGHFTRVGIRACVQVRVCPPRTGLPVFVSTPPLLEQGIGPPSAGPVIPPVLPHFGLTRLDRRKSPPQPPSRMHAGLPGHTAGRIARHIAHIMHLCTHTTMR